MKQHSKPRIARLSGPDTTEAKQNFLGRCVRQKAAEGMSETEALAACTGEWNQARLAAFVENGRAHLTSPEKVRLEDQDEGKPRRFSMLAYTGKVIDWGYWGRFVIDLAGIRAAKETMPALRQHDAGRIVGTIDSTTSDANGFMAAGSFSSSTRDGREVLGLADESFPWQSSIGVQARKVLEVGPGETHQVNGQTVEGPIDVWLESDVFEVSFVPFGADDDTAAISMAAQPKTAPNGQEVCIMNEQLKKLLQRLGLPAGATDEEAQAFLESLDDETMNKAMLHKDEPAQGAEPKTQPEPRKQAGLSAEAVLDLQARGVALGLDADKVSACIKANMSLDANALTVKLVELTAANNKPSVAGAVSARRTEGEKFGKAAEHALCRRCGIKVDKAEPGTETLQGMTLKELARESLRIGGASTKGMDNMRLAGAALGVVRLESTSDFPSILSNVAAKVAMTAYEEAPSTWQAWCATASSTDFKPSDRPQLSEAPSLELITESGEYKHGTFSEFKETNRLHTYGRAFRITRQAIINDDLGMFTRIPRAFGAAAVRRINDLVYAVLTGNQVMAYDNKPLFDEKHGNIAQAASLSADALGKARAAMRVQKGPGGAVLNLQPSFLLVPAALETTADVLLRSTALPDANNSGVYNVWENRLTPVVEARLDASSTTAWYLMASPSQVDTVEVMFLDGIQSPVIEETETMNVDGREYLVRLDVGVRALDHRGMLKNAGA